jgi:hypothetical protein
MNQEGRRKGVPDLIIPVPSGQYCGLAVEMKSISKNKKGQMVKGTLKREQKKWIDSLKSFAWRVEVCYNAEQAITLITEHLKNSRVITPA